MKVGLESPIKHLNLSLAKPAEQPILFSGPSLLLHPAFPVCCFHPQEIGTLCATNTSVEQKKVLTGKWKAKQVTRRIYNRSIFQAHSISFECIFVLFFMPEMKAITYKSQSSSCLLCASKAYLYFSVNAGAYCSCYSHVQLQKQSIKLKMEQVQHTISFPWISTRHGCNTAEPRCIFCQ